MAREHERLGARELPIDGRHLRWLAALARERHLDEHAVARVAKEVADDVLSVVIRFTLFADGLYAAVAAAVAAGSAATVTAAVAERLASTDHAASVRRGRLRLEIAEIATFVSSLIVWLRVRRAADRNAQAIWRRLVGPKERATCTRAVARRGRG